jgi:hypothetical protein
MKDYNPLEELCNAIILQAVEDYREALKGKIVGRRSPEIVIRECERFFLSHWFEALTKVDGDALMRTIRQEIIK